MILDGHHISDATRMKLLADIEHEPELTYESYLPTPSPQAAPPPSPFVRAALAEAPASGRAEAASPDEDYDDDVNSVGWYATAYRFSHEVLEDERESVSV